MMKRRKIAAFVLAFILVAAGFLAHPALAAADNGAESAALIETEGIENDGIENGEIENDGIENGLAQPDAENAEEPVGEDGGGSIPEASAYMPIAPAFGGVANSADVGEYVEFDDWKLEFGDSTVEIDGHTYQYGYYTFSIKWKTVESSIKFDEGDFFTFTVPKEFGGLTLEMTAANGDSWGQITLDENGNGKAVFNENISDYQDLKGTMAIEGWYWETETGVPVEWTFIFGGDYIIYTGESEGIGVDENWIYDNNNDKMGWAIGGGDYQWTISLNQRQEDWSGKITVKDTLGPGHKMAAFSGGLDNRLGYYGKTGYEAADNVPGGEYYLEIALIDWNAMRDDYNKLVEYSISQGSSVILDPDGGSGGYMYEITRLLEKGEYTSYMWVEMLYATYEPGDAGIPAGKTAGSYKYIDKYAGGFDSVEITDGGYTIVFPSGGLSEKCVQINYYTKASASIPQQTLTNICEVSGDDLNFRQDGSAYVSGGATVSGTTGQLILFKQDSEERENLSGVEFTLEKTAGGSYSSTETTSDNTGATTFFLQMPFEGTYTLTENPLTTPPDYSCTAPITLKLNSSGEIIEVNGVPIIGDTVIPGVCHISSDKLILIVYNDKNPTTPGERTVTKTVTKIWEDGKNELELRPDSVTVQLLADGEICGSEIELSEENSWSYTWGNLPEKDDETAIVYTVAEVSVPDGYTPEYSDDTFTITNTLNPQPDSGQAEARITGTKELTGKNLEDGMFIFEARDENGKVVATGTNSANGKIVFTSITFTSAGNFTYTVSEKDGGQNGIEYDSHSYDVQIIVHEEPQSGILRADVIYPDGGVIFRNSYSPPPSVKTAFVGIKRLFGKALKGNMFSFAVRNKDGNIVAMAVNERDGTIRFPAIEFTQPGEYVYTIEEINGGLDGITYDRSVYAVTVIVTRGENGLSLTVSYPKGGIVFINTHRGDPGGPDIPDEPHSPDIDRIIPPSDPEPPFAGEIILGNGMPPPTIPRTGINTNSAGIIALIGGALCAAGALLRRRTKRKTC